MMDFAIRLFSDLFNLIFFGIDISDNFPYARSPAARRLDEYPAPLTQFESPMNLRPDAILTCTGRRDSRFGTWWP
jgi:hypothetical protein